MEALDQLMAHGGAIDVAAGRYGIPVAAWLDLSTGINPFPYPVPDVGSRCWQRLPEASLDLAVRQLACRYYGAGGADHVVAVPGSQAAIQWLPRLLPPPARVVVVGPTYSEHERAWRAAGHEVTLAANIGDAEDRQPAVSVITNPNNPDGRVVNCARLLEMARSSLVVVDEAFMDTCPHLSVVPFADHADLVVLRSFGKFFGLGGIRLGFVFGAGAWIARLRAAIGPWAVSGPALAVGLAAFADQEWIAATRQRLDAAAARLDDLLVDHGFTIVGGTSLFRLADHANARDVFECLAHAGILIRRFADAPTWLRFGLPGPEGDWMRLATALRDVGPMRRGGWAKNRDHP